LEFCRTVLLLFAMMCAACSRQPDVAGGAHGSAVASEDASTETKRFVLRGQVVRLDSVHSTATIRHEKIEAWMDAMTMSFPVKDGTAFRSLHAGDRITAALYVRNKEFWVSEVHREF
jgi:Cu/Ag efflux protein CusF